MEYGGRCRGGGSRVEENVNKECRDVNVRDIRLSTPPEDGGWRITVAVAVTGAVYIGGNTHKKEMYR